jgi:hypothetical protein
VHLAANVDRAAVAEALGVISEELAERLVEMFVERVGVARPPANGRLLKTDPVDRHEAQRLFHLPHPLARWCALTAATCWQRESTSHPARASALVGDVTLLRSSDRK